MARIELKFTKETIEMLPAAPPGKRLEAHDTKVAGLVVRVTDRGIKTFAVYRRVKGRPHPQRATLGRFPDMTIEQARRAARATINTMADGVDPLLEKRAERARSQTLGDVFDEYLASRDLKPGTVADYQRVMHEAFTDWRRRPILEITKDMVERRHAKLGTTSQARANNAMRVLRALFNYAAGRYEDEHGRSLIPENPVRRLSTARAWYRVGRRQTVIKKHDLPAWFEVVQSLDPGMYNSSPATARDYFLFLLFTGTRKSEAANLKRDDIDLQARTFTLPDTKNREVHTLPLPDFIHDLLQARLVHIEGEYVFSAARNDRPLRGTHPWTEKVAAESGVAFTLHDLRRTFTTVAESLDVPMYTLKRLLNHKMSQADVTAGYIVSDVERLRRPMTRISEHLLSIVKAEPGKVVPLRTGR